MVGSGCRNWGRWAPRSTASTRPTPTTPWCSRHSHLIDPAALRADDFDRFFQARSQALLEKIEKAMGLPIAREAVEADVPEAVEYEAEEAEVA
jgi:hypothetical protein